MKTAGIIGGIGPESTIDYYRLTIEAYHAQCPDGDYPSLIINSINFKKILGLMEANEDAKVADLLVTEVQRLARAGADFGLLAANAPHMVFDEIQRRSPIPLISIVQATCDEARTLGLKKLGLLGARFTMQGRFYPEVFSKASIALVLPSPDEQTYIHGKYLNELVKGIFLPETRAQLLAIVQRLKARDGIDGLILGGTELPLILRDSAAGGIPFLDTTQIHVKSMVAQMLA
jgi:aspartate racemase